MNLDAVKAGYSRMMSMLQASATGGSCRQRIPEETHRVPAPSIDALSEWHNFYSVLATASATLLGAMFVVASIGGSLMSEKRAAEVRLFVNPTVIHPLSESV